MNDALDTGILARRGGRSLGYVDTGPRDGPVWFHCHGIPGSSKERLLATAAGGSLRVRLIAIDRPGYGESAPMPRYSLADHADDVLAVAEHLQIDHFSLLGFSGGGVFAMATAQALASRVERLALVGTPCVPLLDDPFSHAGALTAEVWHAALEDPEALATRLATLTGDSDVLSAALMDSLGDREQRCLHTPGIDAAFTDNLVAAIRQGAMVAAESIIRDTRLMIQAWPFDPGGIAPPVEAFYGDSDELVHLAHGRALEAGIKGCSLTVLPRSGHYDTLIDVFARLACCR
ncbi:alpha/beta fold hydrolase [Halomonas urumqiensis]|uniref:AB hydrolase-1 domain-containing protein n=1 Tax=Halomonas urumqiensis TaxID=1684789 RepID=A0A2N7UKF7_9GAMM|nr:alpha/beta hydrolase [Halomonas urumqiensis]PMR80920.1 hypothetical protein C1H70_07660 [Halomonas urumqiensis]PTB02878.1 alpha/beta hydrolase [Halomonas urumqiensis]GHE21400.1 alpha/beta hydrolase [Halomonas urumqiensis]